MGYPFRRGRTVTIKRYELNKRTRERQLAVPQPDPVPSCAFDPGSTNETDDGAQVQEYPRFFGPYDMDVRTDDEITVEGVDEVFQVNGAIRRWRNDLTGSTPCCEVKLIEQQGRA
ncbi:MAG: hypothetical protein HOV78_11665 [Hamadaea sp.]|nr:hypothetical protein [Hamadaea sp.]